MVSESLHGYCYLFVGGTGAGKSTLIKRLVEPISRDRLHVYDINDEYKLGDYADLPDMKVFLKEMNEVKKSVIIFEDATSFFNTRGHSEKLTQLLVRKRHRKNIIFLVFHSVRAVPFYVYNLANGLFLLKTNDTEEYVDKRIPGLLEAFRRVAVAPPTSYPYINFEFVPL